MIKESVNKLTEVIWKSCVYNCVCERVCMCVSICVCACICICDTHVPQLIFVVRTTFRSQFPPPTVGCGNALRSSGLHSLRFYLLSFLMGHNAKDCIKSEARRIYFPSVFSRLHIDNCYCFLSFLFLMFNIFDQQNILKYKKLPQNCFE